ncbi:chaperone protein dnaJ 6 [Eucalyptus grandis]|uniref:chaperone protein dnaJ 6 n=1 Tax=Eucalyptus grandis TaxID=71139 RepID=UPI00192E9884|nr:chaperone protein dnaJ 6 [Eucalyptus grandis]
MVSKRGVLNSSTPKSAATSEDKKGKKSKGSVASVPSSTKSHVKGNDISRIESYIEDLAGEVAQNLHEYFRVVYKVVTEADIEEFEANYRGSDSEKNDLIDLYKKFKGDMNRLFCSMLCSDPKLDSHRFKDIIDNAIAAGTLKTTKAYEKWAKQISKTKPPTDPLRKRGKAKKKSDNLLAIISQRRSKQKEHFNSMFSSLVNKYGGGMQSSEPSEEEFEAARKKLESQKSAKKSRQK